MTDSALPSRLEKYSKENSWYYKDLTSHLTPISRKLLEEYSDIPPEHVDAHVYKLRDILWSQAPYPCIGEFKFLTLNLPKHPKYKHLLSLLRPSPPAPGPFMLDLGCCIAQELRSLTYAGIPSINLFGSDVVSSYLTTSYELFNDASTFQATLVPANIFSPTLFEDSFQGWENKFTVVHAGLFLHLFNREQQIAVCERVVKLMKMENGSMFLGEMVGCRGEGVEDRRKLVLERRARRGSRYVVVLSSFSFVLSAVLIIEQFLHDEESFAKLWGDVAEVTGTKGQWKVESKFRERARGEGNADGESKGGAFFTGEGIGWIKFSVERI